ncbi:MAG: endolytic transglycosylase MltG [Flavobacteriaceae bacterium]|tara:strand:+ start:377 stop:1414 length:1038 start_codon:yes stop_codon:yes gene_type:complete
MYIKRILILIALIGLIFMGSFSFYVYKVMFMSNTSFEGDSIDLYIKTGTTNDQLFRQIDSYLLSIDDFSVLAQRKKYKVRPGKYIIKNGMNNNEIINSLRSNNVTVNVTFNNVKNLNDLAGRLSTQIEADSISFLSSFQSDYFIGKGFDEKNILSMYIPNSYNFFWNTSAEKFNERMFEEYTKFWQINNRVEKANKIGLSKKEVMILASIVYEESKQNIELSRIAGVYMNRLNDNWKLGADPTVKFAAYQLDQYKNTVIRRVLNKHLKIDSPYNTYKYYGLPPGIISMPSIQAVDAVLNYEKHNYYFFAANPSNPGYHSFAKSLAEHKRNARKFHKYLNSKGIKK